MKPSSSVSRATTLLFAVLIFAALLPAACWQAGDDSGSDAGASVCDGKESCDDCRTCANNNPCAGRASSCLQSAACVAIDQCIPICGADLSCQNDCYSNNPGGVALYSAWRDCLYCEQCPDDCAGYETCG